MITIPLSTVIAYLTRKGASFMCLAGAPMFRPGPTARDLRVVDLEDIGDGDVLYLGERAGIVCPAALGWATEVLRAVFDTPRPCVIEDTFSGGGSVCLWGVCGWLYARWTWREPVLGRTFREVSIGPRAPPTPAERLKAVLEYEMGRA